MRRKGGLRWRLLAAIGLLATLFIAVLVILLVALRNQRDADHTGRQASHLVYYTGRVQTAMAQLVAAERGVALANASPRSVTMWREAEASLSARAEQLRKIDTGNDPTARQIRATLVEVDDYLHGVSRPLVAAVRATPSTPHDAIDRSFRGQRAIHIGARIQTILNREARVATSGRDRESTQAHLAEVIGFGGIAATIAFVLVFVAYVQRAAIRPLERVAGAARALTSGDLRARVEGEPGPGEVGELARTFDTMAASLEESRRRLEQQNEELASQRRELVDAVRSAREGASVVRAVLDATPDAIALLDRSGGVLVDNPPMRAVRAAFGAHATALDESGALVPLDAGSDGHADQELRDELMLLGTRRAFARYAAPVRDGSGRPIGRLLVLREITGEREAERVKDEFFALVSHELRTPLTSILGYVELVLGDDEEPIPVEHRHHLEVVERNAQRLLRLVGDLLFAAQVETGTLLLEPGEVDLSRLAREAVDAARPRAEEGDIVLEARLEAVPPTAGDRDRIAQVLDNLISNALKFTPEDGHVEVRLTRRDGLAQLEVADTGVGIPMREQPRLFDRFFRASNATSAAVPGLGLGLMIVRAIVEGHGGSISVHSEVGAGTTFTVQLPLRPAQPTLIDRRAEFVRYSVGGRYR